MKEMEESLSNIVAIAGFMIVTNVMILQFMSCVLDDSVAIVQFVVLIALDAAMTYWARTEFEYGYECMLEEEA